MSAAQKRPQGIRPGTAALATAALATAATLGVAAGAATGAAAAGAATPSSGNSGSTAAPATLAGIKAKAATDITARVNALNSAIAKVNAAQGLGSGQATLVSYLGTDLAPLQQLNQTIQGDTTVQQAGKDFATIFSGYRVYLLVLPASLLAADAFHVTTTSIPQLTADATKAQGYVNPGNQAQLQPLLGDLNTQIGTATSATSGLASAVLAFTPAQLNADRDLLSSSRSSAQNAHAALAKGRSDLQQIRTIIKGSSTATAG
jgi:hypothetical protein